MQIQELETLSGLDRATIRYYEKENLIQPFRKENGYREYGDSDLQELLRIKLMRQLGLSLDKIKDLQQGREALPAVLFCQQQALEKAMSDTQNTIQICKELQTHGICYSNLNATDYLNKIYSQQETNNAEQPAAYHDEPTCKDYHPIRRLVARMTDYSLPFFLLNFILIVVLRIRPFEDWWTTVLQYVTLFLSVPVTAFMLWKWGTTPGKCLMGIRVTPVSKYNDTYTEILAREWTILRRGYGFGIPFWRVWRLYRSYIEYRDEWYMDWDFGFDCCCDDWRMRKKAVYALACAALIAISATTAIDVVRPKYRGNDITVAEFAENFNFYLDMTEISARKMKSDGSWADPAASNTSQGVVVIIGGASGGENDELSFDTDENGNIRQINYNNSWTDISLISPISNSIQLVCVTALMSQTGVGILDLHSFSNILSQNLNKDNYHMVYDNIEIEWTIDAENCINSSGMYVCPDKTKSSSLSISLTITIH